ncbi:MAG: orotidine-5'-phosphate decarboxylase [Acidobacteriota bacterium]|nr:orotidine-5'-phosphate decarboxylase [Acidobacteriota bacterium]
MTQAENPMIIALDIDNAAEALALVNKIGPTAGFYKVGMELYAASGMQLVSKLSSLGKKIFLDLKLYDIGETVKRAARQICRTGVVDLLTVHGSRSVMQAAVEGREGAATQLLAVTVLTSFDQDDLADLGYPVPLSDLVELRVRKAVESGMDGIVCSPLEVARVRQIGGPKLKLVTPGVRSRGAALGDQKRVATPSEALRDGADYLVIGRQVTRAVDPRIACQEIFQEISEARSLPPR